MRRALKWALLLPLLVLIAIAARTALRQPSLTRQWDEDVRVLAGVSIAGDTAVTLTNIRDWSYTRDSIAGKSYFDATYDPRDIVDVWMYEQILDDRGLIAHTFLVFDFDSAYSANRHLGISVETRREVGETYSLVGGVLRTFEVTHIWATERDLVTRRVEFLDYPLTRYRLNVPEESRARLFIKLARETRDLATEPRWYNTVSNNCTSSLIKYANESRPGSIPLHYSWVFTGKIDEHLAELGYIDPDSPRAITRDFLASNSGMSAFDTGSAAERRGPE